MATQQAGDSETPVHQILTSVHEPVPPGVQDPTDVLKRRIANDHTAYNQISAEPGNEQFRLIYIFPAKSEEDEIVCALLTHSLKAPETPYIALSYCWGDLGEQRTISLIHGCESSWEEETPTGKVRGSRVDGNTARPFNVTLSLYSALRSIRNSQARNLPGSSSNIHGPVWVDAICINQENLAERNSQVGAMGSIYSRASSVWIWLGESEEMMEGLDLISWLIRPGQHFMPDGLDLLNPEEDRLIDLLFAMSNLSFGRGAKGPEGAVRVLEKLFSHPYWRRIWVLQEATIRAETTFIHTTHNLISWPRLLAANRIVEAWRRPELNRMEERLPQVWIDLVTQRLSSVEGASSQNAECDLPEDLGHERSLITLFLNSREDFDATDLRDKVFALLDLSVELQGDKKTTSKLKPDYSKSISQVFTEFTMWLIHNKGASVLSYVSNGLRRVLPDNLVLEDGNDVLPRSLDATQHPSWAIWPATAAARARDWRVVSLYQTPQGARGGYGVASRVSDPAHTYHACSVWSRISSSISDRLIGLGGKQMGVVKSILRLPLCLYSPSQSNGTKRYRIKGDTTDEDASDENRLQVVSNHGDGLVSLGHPYLERTPLPGALPFVWREIQKARTNGLTFGDEIIDTKEQQWLGREESRYAERPEHMFRDFLETILLDPVVRGNEADGAPDGDGLPGGPWNDPDVAAGFAAAWFEDASAMECIPTRIGKRLKALLGQPIPLDKLFPYLFKGSGRCFFITEDERMGMCGPDVNPGDIIVGLYGSGVPFVLRPVGLETPLPGEDWSFQGEEGFRENLFRFMGDCYVHNRMSSAFFENILEVDEKRIFYMC